MSCNVNKDIKSNTNSNINSEANRFFGKEIIFSDSLKFLCKDVLSPINKSIIQSSESKIITIINGSCMSCIEEIHSWENIHKSLIDRFGTDKILFVFIETNIPFFRKIYYPEIPYDFQIIIDEDGHFIKDNGINNLIVFDSFLLDQYNRVKLIGNPIKNKDLFNLYLNNI